MENKIKNLEEHVRFLYDELESKETEIDDFKKSLDDAKDMCRKQSASKYNDQEDIMELKKLVEEQKIKISCLRKHRNEILDRHENTIDEYEKEFKAKEDDIKCLQEASKEMKQQIIDLKEELGVKDAKIHEFHEKISIKESIEGAMKSTQTSLLEELANAESEATKKQLQDKVDVLEKELIESKFKSNIRTKMLEKMEIIEHSNKNNLVKLENKINTPGSAGGPGGCDRTLAVAKNRAKMTFFSGEKKRRAERSKKKCGKK